VDLQLSGGDSNMNLAAYFSFDTMVGAHLFVLVLAFRFRFRFTPYVLSQMAS
jgi:hypothetical protein